MRIKTQFIISIIAFTIVLIIIAASVADTEQQTAYFANQQVISSNIERGASSLNSVSIDYFLYQEDLQLSKWNSTLYSLSSDLQSLDLKGYQQQMHASSVANDLQNLNVQFAEVAAYLRDSPRNVSVRIDPAFQFRWSSMALQSQTLASDASQLSQSINDQVHQTSLTNILLILSLVGTFGAFLLTIYLLVFRRTLKSIAGLQKGITTIGTGNLDYKIEIQGQNEITELSTAFNKMTRDLKTVTASKTELERTQASLKESEQRWATTLSSIGDAVIATDTSGNVIFMNGVAEKLTGWTLSEASRKTVKNVFKIVNEQTNADVESPVDRVLKEGVVVGLANHTMLIRKDGTEVPIDDSGAPIKDQEGNTTGVVLIFRDITERKKAEKALEESEHLHRQIFDNSQDGFQLVELIYGNNKVVDFSVISVNSAYERQTGLKANFVVGKRVKEFAPDLEQYWFDACEQVDKTSIPMHIVNYSQSLLRWFDVYLFSYAKGKIGSLFTDITEHKKMEAQLKASSAYSRNLIEASLDPLITISPEGKITDVNKATENATGCSKEELIGSDFSSYFTEPEKAAAGYKLVFTEGFITDYPLSIKHKSGRVTDVLYNAVVYLNETGEIQGVFAAARDITERRKLEKQVQDSERLAAIGATAGMVGHDIRNPLQAITGDIYLAKTELDGLPDSEEKKAILESLTETEKNVDYINKIVADLQDFARPLKPNAEETDLKRIIDELLAKNGLPKNIKVGVKLETEEVVADSTFISRIMYNLVNNAVQAMPKGGRLTIHTYKEADDTVITVKDTGVGIPDNVRGKLFTPMFTTKSKGQGFGLAVIKRMTESLGGTVSFVSQEGKGTTFKIRLPPKELNGKWTYK